MENMCIYTRVFSILYPIGNIKINLTKNFKSENPLCIYTDPPYFYNDMIDNRNHIKIINKDK